MGKRKSIISGLLIAVSLLLTIGCDLTGTNDAGYTEVTFLSAEETGGTSSTVDSTGLTLTFDVDPTTSLKAGNIILLGATKGELSGSGTTRNLAISDIIVGNGATVSVAIMSPSGVLISGLLQTANIYRKIYALRDTGPAGGLIFYDKGAYSYGWRYLESAPQSTEWTYKEWGDIGTEISGDATLTDIGHGQAATAVIVAHMEGKSITGTAAQLCDALSVGEYSDWFLPSKDELNAIWTNIVVNGFGGFSRYYYWSSSEGSSDDAWNQLFDDGGQDSYRKNISIFCVRAVRAF